MKFLYYFSFLCVFPFLSCERSLPFPEKTNPPVLVANALFKADSSWQVYLTKSELLDSSILFSAITNARVQIQNLTTSDLIQLQHQEQGIYRSQEQLPKQGNNYQLVVQATNFPTIQATNAVPNDFSIAIQKTNFSTYQQQPHYLFEITIQDDPTTANYYLIRIVYKVEKQQITLLEKAGHFSFDPNSENEKVVIDHFDLPYSFLPDENFNGQAYTTQVGATSSLLNQLTPNDQLTAILTVQSITEDGYRYKQALTRFENFDDELFADPIGGYSNIEGGLGIFAGSHEQRIMVRLQ